MTSVTAQCQGQMGRRYESIYVNYTDGVAIQCPHPDFLSPETEINNAFIIGSSCQAAERTQCSRATQGAALLSEVFETWVSSPSPPLLSLSFSLWDRNAMDHKGEKESSFDAELHRLNKPRQGDCGCFLLCSIFMPGHLLPGPGHVTRRGLTLVRQLLSLRC